MPTKLILFFTLAAIQCQLVGPEQWSRDYYYARGHVQIQGTATLPPVKQYISTQSGSKTHFRSLEERREFCLAQALKKGHLKWLALMDSDRRTQAEWDQALREGETGPWARCLALGKVQGAYFDAPGECRVAVVYPCLPRNY